MKLKAILFDVFNTVVDFSGVPKDEIREYVAATRLKPWRPLKLPESWEHLPPFPDSAEGIKRLRKKYQVATLSNGPSSMLFNLLHNAGIKELNVIIDPSEFRCYKPDPAAYLYARFLLDLEPEQVMMVTANKDFGDLEQAGAIGMQTALIRHEYGFRDIHALADCLEGSWQ